MKNWKKSVAALFCGLAACLFLASCDEDLWYIYSSDVSGTWYVANYPNSSTYRYGDRWQLRSDGAFRAWGSGGLSEYGEWWVTDNVIYIDFDGDYLEDIAAYIDTYDDYQMYLTANDYYTAERYRLVLERESWYAPKKE